MNLADVYTYLFSILGFITVFIGYWLFAFALFPRFVERCAERAITTPVKSTLLGLVTLAPLVFIGLTASGKAPNVVLKIIALAVVLFSVLAALLGASGIALRIGSGLNSSRDENEPWRRILRGGIVLGLTFVLPFLGQFVMLPGTLCAGFGSILLGRVKPAPAPAAEPAPAASTAATPAL